MKALDGLHAPRLAASALRFRPDDGLRVRVVDEVAAARDLDAVAAGLDPVEEEALRDRVLRRRRLDVDVVLDEDVGRAQHLLAGVDPEGEVVETTARTESIRDVDELVCGDREAHPGAGLLPVVQHHLLVEAVAEDVLREDPVRADVVREQVDVVEPLDRRTSRDVPLRLVLQRRPEVRRRLVPLGLVVDLDRMAVRVGEAVRRPMTEIALDQPRPSPAASIAATRRESAAALQARRAMCPRPLLCDAVSLRS